MSILVRRRWVSAGLGAMLVLYAGAVEAIAAQQKWASQYVGWKSDGKVSEVIDVDQQVWIARPNDRSFWPMQFGFSGQKYGGYIGLQQRSASEQQARFAIWNATAAQGASCKPFDNEGVGQTCILPIKIEPGKFYRLRLMRLEAAADGQWWGGFLVSADRNGKLSQQPIGRIKAPIDAKTVNPNSLRNFVEYYGPTVATCDRVPLSVVAFTPPAINRTGMGAGTYQGSTSYNGSKKASGNTCESGRESNGASITAVPQTFAPGDGVMMFLGGTPGQHVLDLKARPAPAALPNN